MHLGKDTSTTSEDAVVDRMETDGQNEVSESQDKEQDEDAQPIQQVV